MPPRKDSKESDDPRMSIHECAAAGDAAAVEQLLDEGVAVDTLDTEQQTPLHLAARNGHRDTAELLINHGADLGAKVEDSDTLLLVSAMDLAAREGHISVVEVIVQHDAELNVAIAPPPPDYSRALHLAVYAGHFNVVKLLIQKGHPEALEALNAKEEQLLHVAVWKRHEDITKLLIEHGADVAGTDNYKRTPLHRAATMEDGACRFWGQREEADGTCARIAEFLIKHGADVEARDEYAWTPLLLATMETGRGEVAKLLLANHDVNTEVVDDGDRTPLLLAVGYGSKDIADLLLQHGADVGARNVYLSTPLHCASSVDIAELLIRYGADVSARNQDQETPLFRASQDVAELLIKRGADVNARDSYQRTPLHVMADGDYDVAEFLINNHAEINVAGTDSVIYGGEGFTPLSLASQCRHTDVVDELLLLPITRSLVL